MNENNIKEIMKKQSVINIGMIGHVSNGKSTIVRQLTGKATQQFTDEKVRNITIRLGYANAKIYKCNKCEAPKCYTSTSSNINEIKCKYCLEDMELINHVSFVDCPGHNMLMSTMLNGTCVMDYTVLVESFTNNSIPSIQTDEHVKATTLTGTKNKIVCINKIDLIKKDEIKEKINEFKKYSENTILHESPIIPIVASMGLNMDILCEYLGKLQVPERNLDKTRMIVIRSFNVNKPGIKISKLQGGVVGGSLIYGKINVNDRVILKPGYYFKNNNYDEDDYESKRWFCKPISSKIVSINSENNKLEYAIPGGLIGIQLDIDPALTQNDNLIGNILIPESDGDEYNIYEDIEIKFNAFDNNYNIRKLTDVYVNVNANNIICEMMSYRKRKSKMILKCKNKPICVKIGDIITLSIKANNDEGEKVIGNGEIIDGNLSGTFN